MNRRVAPFLLSAVLPLVAPRSAQALNPPEYTLWAEIKNSVGETPGVEVGPLNEKEKGSYIVPVKVKDHDQAVAVASIMTLSHEFGNITVEVRVTDGGGSPVNPVTPGSSNQLADLVRKALRGNCRLKEVVVKSSPLGPRETVYPVFTRSVIQFPNDDLSDLYSNFNGVAAAVFRYVLASAPGGYHLNPSTAKD